MKDEQSPLVIIVSNRGPFSFQQEEDGTFSHQRGQGGLVTALAGVIDHYDVLWVAAALSEDDEKWAIAHDDQPQEIEGTRLQLVRLPKEAYDLYYNVIANPLLWFIHHQMWNIPRKPDIDKSTWAAWHDGYKTINRVIAEAVAPHVNAAERQVVVLPQDYHLYLFPYFLRGLIDNPKVQIQPFIHIPWPGPDSWRLLPAEMRTPIFDSLLNADRIGFQTERDAFNFVQTCRFHLPDAHSRGSRNSIEYQGRKVHAASYPISIDVDKLQTLTEEAETRLLKSRLAGIASDNKIILRVDRIEPSKNILRGLQAFRELLETKPQYRGKVQMLMLLVPSRMDVEEYQSYLQAVMAEAGMINAEFSDSFWEPVRIIVGNNYPRAIAAFQLYDVLLVNPIADGMNLVAKEGALVNERNGVLILSENAGAVYELGEHALVINPFDIHSTALAMDQALKMSAAERETRADAMRRQVLDANVRMWFRRQLDDAVAAIRNAEKPKKATKKATPSN
ncbi:MAG: trehalose-6-phosphate synthase [Anaerolineaceae bacterium]|nr:MAG: trehalose-6-phosphate synthase [Anaerolineaceae bacterium]